MLKRNTFVPGFSPLQQRRGAQVGQNLPGASANWQNLAGVGSVEALVSALQACCLPCPTSPAVTPAAVAAAAGAMNQPQRCRRTLMGLPKLSIPGLSAGTDIPQIAPTGTAFRGLRLTVPTDISPSGDLVSMLVGNERQTQQTDPPASIPLRSFDQTSQDTGFIDMDWIPPAGSKLQITVSNKFAAPYIFEGALEGLQLV